MSQSNALSAGQRLLRLTVIGAIPLLLVLLLLWAGGWLTPQQLSADKLVNVLQQAGGDHPGYRRNHAKGLCVIGSFESNGRASDLSQATLFAAGSTPVIGRLAIAGGNPNAADFAVPVRSMALSFHMAGGEEWRTGMNALPFFPVATVAGFYDQQSASLPDPATGKPNPAKMQAFIAAHPEVKAFMAWVKQRTPSSSWASDRFNSLNAFRFIDKSGNSHLVRWSMVPQTSWQPIGAADKENKNFLQQDLKQRLTQGPLKWDLIVTLAQPGDVSNDASKAWPVDRQTLNAGTLVINSAVDQMDGPCNNINYDPLILPNGIAASDDPLLNARSAAYAKSYNLRTHEEAAHQGNRS
ncbi:catalase [[Pantoea] beijingensis]|uniref:Catalase-related peroxidase n=1 Tax=[Pantoea] beijingensis TaxID=1324864 RepID=A0A443IAI7_9GAMM|nr:MULTISPECIES: catalase family peroxidase [Erwiniaceae]RWR00926.1 catalase [[Pantoea] beijingensis]